MSQTKTAITNMLFLFLRMIVTMGISLYSSRIILEALGVVDYGIYNVIGGMVALISFLHYSLNGATIRFMNDAMASGEFDRLKLVFNTTFVIHIIIALIIVLLCETVGLWFFYNKLNIPPERISAASFLYQFSIASMVLNVIQIPYDSAIIAHQKMKIIAYVSILESILKLLVAFLVLNAAFDHLIFYGFLLLIVSLIIRLIYQIYCRIFFKECRLNFILDNKLFKEISVFFGWDVLGNISALSRNQGISILQNVFFGPLINAAMGVANIISNSISAVVANVSFALKPQIFQTYSKKDFNRSLFLVATGTRISFFLLILGAIPFLLNTHFFLSFWLKEVPQYSVEFTQLLLISILIGTLFDYLTILINATGKIKLLSILGTIVYSSSVIISYILLKIGYNLFTTSIIHVIVTIIMGLGVLFIANKLTPQFSISYFTINVLLKNIIVFFIAGTICFFVRKFLLDINIFVSIGVELIIIISIIFFIGLNKTEKNELKIMIQKFIPIKPKKI
ncbi:hypothetical protein HX096_08095 [Empedobacter falsenii]|uniref:hypothetical protein n=1 Tax=Empedobacter falsenii TaxID=343874 RepID=UPI002575E907|nr:hypothetical protein [Empedobacter falsenii]MDM1547821.1 hypothetical protein [Empedobacter falsenii]